MELLLVQILVAVAIIQSDEACTIALRTGVEKVSMPTAVGHGLVGPKPSGTATIGKGHVLSDTLRYKHGFGEWAIGTNIPTQSGRRSYRYYPRVVSIKSM